MKHLLFSASTLAIALTGTTAFSQAAETTGFTPYGFVSLNSFGVTGGSSDSYFYGDAGFSWKFSDTFGLDASAVGFATDSSDASALYLAVFYDFGPVRVSVGAPRAAFDAFGRFRFQDTMPIIGLSATPLTSSVVTFIDLSASSSNEHSFGVRVDGETASGLEYAISAHGFSDTPDAASINGSLRYSFGEGVTLTAGLEYDFSPSGDDLTKAKIGLSKDFGQYELGIMASTLDGFGSSGITMTELWASYDVNDRFEIGASYITQSGGSDLVTLDASYEIFPNGKLALAMARPTSGSSETLYNVGLRYDF